MLRPAIFLSAAAILVGGLRDPRLFALGGAAVWVLILRERPLLGPARAWLPWLAWSFMAAALSAQPAAALSSLSRWSAALAFASLAAAWSAEEREDWLKAVGICAVALAAAALWTGAGERWRYGPSMTGFLPPYYNYTAFALAACAAGGGALAFHPRSAPRLRAAGAAVLAVGAAMILLAGSRGALLGLAIGTAVWTIRRWGARAAAGAATVALIGAVSFGPSLLEKSGRPYAEARPLIWRAAAAVASESPWFGEGPGSFSVGFRRHPIEAAGGAARWGLYTDYAHSEILQAAAETGWAGLALWLIGFGTALAVLARRASAEPAREAAAAAVAAMSVQLFVDNMIQIPGLAFLFLGASGVASERRAPGPRWPAWGALAGCVLALTAWMPRVIADKDAAKAVVIYPAEAERWETAAWEMMSKDSSKADEFWSRAQGLSPFNGLYPHQRARLAAARGDWAEAESLSRAAILNEPGYANARVLRAEALFRLKRPVEALSELAATRRVLATRGDKPRTAHYDEAIWGVDEKELARVEKLAGTRR